MKDVPKDVAEEVCAWMAKGLPLRRFCEIPGNPGRTTVHDWTVKDPEFATRLESAKRIGNEEILDQILEIADDGSGDVARDKVRIEARWKYLACREPKVYGTKVAVGGDGGAPIRVETGPTPPSPLDLATQILQATEIARAAIERAAGERDEQD